MYENIKVEFDGGVVTITLNRPEKLNAFAGHMRRDLAEALERAGSDPEVRVVVLTGAGRAFCTGADVARMSELMERGEAEEFRRLLGAGRRVLTAMRQMLKPVVAAVNGPAYGAGFNLVLASDIRVAAESATFSQSFVKVGLHPDWGGSFFLPRAVPPNIACEMFFLGDAVDARRAHELGLVNRVVPDAELLAETRRLAERLRAALAVGRIKRSVQSGAEIPFEYGLALERELQQQLFQSEDAREGLSAYVEKRKPTFKGK